jgi:ATP/maltotriose-dependent transcriptional regulator MalT
LVVGVREGNLSEAVIAAHAAEPLLSHIEDPIVRCSFLSQLSYGLGVASRYRDAERFANRQVDEATRFRLNFVLPTALVNLAMAKLGLGSYTKATALIERSEREDTTHDPLLRVEREIVRACIALSRGEAGTALDLLRDISLDDARSDIIGEALATRALTEACCGDALTAERTSRLAEGLAGDVRTQVLLACVQAILALDADESALTRCLDDLAGTVARTGCFDSVVCAMRACPKLVDASRVNTAMREVVLTAAVRSGDAALAAAVGTRVSPKSERKTLSGREQEVLQLVAEGFHNEEIGLRLFISPKTVKTHLQNIFEKLEVRSRTQAVIKASEAGLLR